MPLSRQRKTGKAKKRPQGLAASRPAGGPTAKNELRVKVIIVFLAAAVAASTAAYFVVNRSGSKSKEVTTASGLKYTDTVEGTGPSPQRGQTISVHYVGTLESGLEFDSSRKKGRPYEFKIGTGTVIKGWDEGLMGMKVGGKRQLVVPAKLGYGPQGSPPNIPPNATLLFDVELMGIK